MRWKEWFRKANKNNGLGHSVEVNSQQEVECTQCGMPMTAHCGSESQIRYFCCPSCGRWVSSTYADIFRADAKLKIYAPKADVERECFAAVKARLERWLAALDDQDPFRLLGVSPSAPREAIRNRYRELALSRHPDRGGSAREMQELNRTYERIARHRWGTEKDDDSARDLPLPGGLPAKT